MAHQSSRIYIPEPCHEDWNKMTPQEKGRFCGSCSKVVVDFTKMSTEEIQEYMKSQQGSRVCGHFKKSQLDLPPVTITLNDKIFSMPMTKKFLLATFLVFGFTLFSCAQKTKGEVMIVGKVAAAPVQIKVDKDTVDSYLPADTLEFINEEFNTKISCGTPGEHPEEFLEGDVVYEEPLIDGEIEYIPEEQPEEVIETPPEKIIETQPENHVEDIRGNIAITEIPQEPVETTGIVALPVEDKPVEEAPPECEVVADEMPQYPGGHEALAKYMMEHVQYTKEAKKKKVEGTIYVKFVVTKVGKVTDIKAMNDIGYGLDQQAIKAVQEMPDWKPGKHEGKPTDVEMTLPIRFQLN